MPRIRDAYLDSVVYLYPSEQDAENGKRAGGSGFLVGIPREDLGVVFTYVVSNRHVVENGSTVVRMTTRSGNKEIIPTDERAWRLHPDGDDVALLMMQFNWRDTRFAFVPPSIFLTKEIISEYNIGPGDECFLVGRFINHEGRQRNLPTARFGCLAQLPHEPVVQEGGFKQESFLVEIRSIGGYSGSPVFLHIPFGSERENVADWSPDPAKSYPPFHVDFGVLKPHGPWLLGVDWGNINEWRPVCDRAGRPVNPDPAAMQVALNTGMMAVVPAWKIHDLLFSPEVTAERERIADAIRENREKNAPPATSN